jgi:hypothetical protein
MKPTLFFAALLSAFLSVRAQEPQRYWQVKADFLEPIVNRGFVARLDYGTGRQVLGLVLGAGGRVSEFDNAQFELYEDKTVFRAGLEYQYFLSGRKLNRGLYIGGDLEYASRSVFSNTSEESVENIPVVTPGAWLGWVWMPFKGKHVLIDLAIVHPRYNFGAIRKVEFETVPEPYEPENLFNFLGPWSVGWRF